MKTEATIHTSNYTPPAAFYNNKRTAVYGYELESGDVLEKGDMYESTNGFWEECPCPGLTLQAGVAVRWVRPCR